MRNCVRLGLAAAMFYLSSQAFARTQSGVENFNGYEVRLVDSGRGDDFHIDVHLPLGRLSESGEFIGRASLLHKMIKAQMPAQTSALLDFGSTHYQVEGRSREAQALVRGLLAPLRTPNWSSELSTNVRSAAVAEAEGRAPMAEEDYLFAMMFELLLPPTHAWSLAPWGDPAAVSRFSLESLRAYFHANYRPENVKITVRGNFSDAEFYENVRIWLADTLGGSTAVANVPFLPPLSPNWSASFFGNANSPVESERRLYVASQSERYNLVVLEGDLAQFRDFEALDRLVARLNAQPWPDQALFHWERVGLKAHLSFIAKSGALNLEAFRRLAQEQNAESPGPARLFHPARALYVEMGPELEEMERDTRFQRAYKFLDNRAALREYSELFEAQPCELKLKIRDRAF